MKTVILASACALALAGCSTLSTLGVIAGTSVSPQTALVLANSFDAIETVATGYLQLPPCGSTTGVCRQQAAVANIVPAIRSGRTARNQIEALLKANTGAAIPIASYNTLDAAITTLQSVYSQYNIKG